MRGPRIATLLLLGAYVLTIGAAAAGIEPQAAGAYLATLRDSSSTLPRACGEAGSAEQHAGSRHPNSTQPNIWVTSGTICHVPKITHFWQRPPASSGLSAAANPKG